MNFEKSFKKTIYFAFFLCIPYNKSQMRYVIWQYHFINDRCGVDKYVNPTNNMIDYKLDKDDKDKRVNSKYQLLYGESIIRK